MPSIPQGIIDFAFSPPFGVMNSHLDTNGPYGAGNHTLTTWSGFLGNTLISATYGVLVNFNGAIPPKLGRKLGYSDGVNVDTEVFEDRIVQIVVQHQLLSGVWVVTQLVEVYTLPLAIRFTEALPGRIGLYVAPNLNLDLFYLTIA